MGGVAAAAIGLAGLALSISRNRNERNSGQYNNNEIERAYQATLNKLNEEKNQLINQKKEYDKQIRNMNKIIKEQNNSFIKKEKEYEKQILEQKEKEIQREIQENNERQIALNQCKEYLSEENLKYINNSLNEYKKKSEKWIKQITENDIENRKKEFSNLFQQLFVDENIQNEITNKFIEIFKENYPNKDLKKMNFMIIGASGVGKSTLINALLREDVAKEGLGGVCTTEIKKYESKNYPFLCLYDSVGAELGKNFTLEDVQNETINLIVKQLNNPDPDQHIHCIIYCVTFNRFYEEETKIILKIREKYDGKKLPIIIAYTMGNNNKKIKAVKERIIKCFKNYNESISDDIFNNNSYGINFLKIYSKEDDIEVSDKKYFQYCFGLSDLISICYNKGKNSYKIAIQNSLIQIAENYFINNIENKVNLFYSMCKEFEIFLGQQFEPNFTDFISFLFENITIIEKYKKLKKINPKLYNIIIDNDSIILKNNLNNNSIIKIKELIKIYKNEMIKIMKKNFDIFTEEQAETIYYNLLEELNRINKNSKINLQEAMKSKEQIKKESIEAIKRELKEIAEENFLKNSTILLLKDIIEVFKIEMKEKINKFINNLKNNQEIQTFFKSFDVFDVFEPTKDIEIGKDFKKYIEELKEIENESYEKSLKQK